MDLKNNLISICSTINIFFHNSYTIKKIFMLKQNPYTWEPTKLQIYEIILFSYTYLAKNCDKYTKEFDFPPQYISNMVRGLADSMMTSFFQVKSNNYNL